jgi:predicted acetyltransferase
LEPNERVINLKEEEIFIEQYVDLRNTYSELLLTKPVGIRETREWLQSHDIEIRGIVQDDRLLGAAILYLNRDGEIAFFVRYPFKGIGNRLLNIMELVGKERKIKKLWAWVLDENIPAKKTFLNNGYRLEGKSEKLFKDRIRKGVILSKRVT